mgnify:CR=1 FL=1
MKKIIKMENLECAHCAAKMEKAIGEIEGVNNVTISFMAQKMILDADDGSIDEILKKIVKVCRKVEPDCDIII